jgi:hypothetical protein
MSNGIGRATVAAALLHTHPGCRPHARRDFSRFAAAAIDAEGLWWEVAFDARPSELTTDDVRYVLATWTAFLDGGCPFRRPRVRA